MRRQRGERKEGTGRDESGISREVRGRGERERSEGKGGVLYL